MHLKISNLGDPLPAVAHLLVGYAKLFRALVLIVNMAYNIVLAARSVANGRDGDGVWLPCLSRYIFVVFRFSHYLIVNCLERTHSVGRFKRNVVRYIAREYACFYFEGLSVKLSISIQPDFVRADSGSIRDLAKRYFLAVVFQRTTAQSVSVDIDIRNRIIFNEVAVAAIRVDTSVAQLLLSEASVGHNGSNGGGCDLHFVA